MSDPFDPDDLDAEHVQPYGVRVTTPDGEEFEFEVPETFRGMNLNDLLELYRERVAMDGVDDLEPGRWYAEQVEEDHGVNPDDEDGPVLLPDGGEEDEISTRDLVAALQVAEAHPEMVEYVRRADERGGTGLTNSLRTFYRGSGVETMNEIGSNLEKCLWRGGARAVLNHELPGITIDTTNEEILRAIDDEATEEDA